MGSAWKPWYEAHRDALEFAALAAIRERIDGYHRQIEAPLANVTLVQKKLARNAIYNLVVTGYAASVATILNSTADGLRCFQWKMPDPGYENLREEVDSIDAATDAFETRKLSEAVPMVGGVLGAVYAVIRGAFEDWTQQLKSVGLVGAAFTSVHGMLMTMANVGVTLAVTEYLIRQANV